AARGRAGTTPEGRAEQAVAKAAALLANPDHARMSIDALARRCGFSRNRLAAAFRRRHGETMARFRARHLVLFAQQWMADSDLTLDAIAAKIGVRDPHHFNKLFRRCVGQSPSAWRAQRLPVRSSVARPAIDGEVPAWSGGRPNVERVVRD
ncbi:MAG: helix-turn-helix transcriptional regulator, partial [Planctomycetes bacterium]|nr:helix-turn-helix transcriptional regulator [Planctomycetota bacterium]